MHGDSWHRTGGRRTGQNGSDGTQTSWWTLVGAILFLAAICTAIGLWVYLT